MEDENRVDVVAARSVACSAVAAALDCIDPEGTNELDEVLHLLARVLRNPEVLL